MLYIHTRSYHIMICFSFERVGLQSTSKMRTVFIVVQICIVIALSLTCYLVIKNTHMRFFFMQEIATVSLHYKEFNDEAIEFINRFADDFENFPFELNVQLVPIGYTSENIGLAAQLCVLISEEDQHKQVEFVRCLANQNHPSHTDYSVECCQQNSMNCTGLDQCVEDGKFVDYLQANRELTRTLIGGPLEKAVVITFNGVYDEKKQMDAMKDFHETVCGVYTDKPAACVQEVPDNIENNIAVMDAAAEARDRMNDDTQNDNNLINTEDNNAAPLNLEALQPPH